VIDISHPATPQRVGGYDTAGTAVGVAVAGNYAYVADYTAGLQVIDISNPANPQRVGGYDTAGYADTVAVAGNYAYVADDTAGLQVIDISNPANPQRVGGYATPSAAYGVAVAGNYAYVAAGNAGLQVIDISNPANPQRVGGYDTAGMSLGVTVAGNYAYVADYTAGLQVIDISNPANPQRVGGYVTIGNAGGVAVAGNYAYVADQTAGLQVIDISHPANPQRVGGSDTVGTAMAVAVAGNFAYVADGTAGLQILTVGPVATMAGIVRANIFAGDAAGLTNLNAAQLAGGTLADARLSANVALLNTNQAFTASNRFAGVVTATNVANTFVGAFTGNAAGLTNLDATDLTGTLADARLSANVALLNTNQAFTGSNRFAGVVTATNVANTFAGAFTGNAAGLTNLDATDLTGTLADARLSANVALLNTNQAFTSSNRFAGVVTATNVANTFVGAFTGNAGGLTNLDAADLAGTVPDARLSANVALLNTNQALTGSNRFAGVVTATNVANTFVGAFTGNGGALTNLDATDLTGTVPDARLSTNVALLNTNQAFTGSNRFAGVVTATNAANTFVGTFTGNGAGLTNLSASQLTTGTVPVGQLPAVVVTNNAPAVALAGSFAGNGGGLTNLSGAAIIAGTISSNQLAANSVDASKVVDGSITAAELASDPASLAKVSGGAMAVTSGKIGIGVAAPAYPLTFANVFGDKISLWGNSGAHYGFGIQSSLLQIYSGASGGDIAFGCGESTNFTENVRFKGNGNVGIGTSTPSSTLDVNGMASADSLRVRGQSFLSAPLDVSGNAWTLDQDQDSYNGSTYGGAGMWQSFTAGTNGALVGVALLYGATDGVSQWNAALAIYDGEGTGGRILASQTIMGDGPVAWRQFSLNSPVMVSSGNKYTIYVDSDISCRWFKSTANPYAGGMGYYATNDDYCFRTYLASGTSSPALTIQGGDGNVGIGTHTPGFPLTFANVLGDKISLWGQSGANYGFGIQGSQLQIHSDGSGSDVVFGYGQSTNFAENVRFKGNGNVGIGANNPAQKLVVAGNIYATGTITPNSDRTLKTDFAPVDAAAVLDKVVALPVQQWRFQAEDTAVKHVGPMAQDFRAAFGLGEIPTAIATVDADGVALAAIQGLNEKVEGRSEELEARSEKAEGRIKKLEEQLSSKDAELQALKASVAELQAAIRRPTPVSE
jgi:uncharacterized coiled-coil protein SlyX